MSRSRQRLPAKKTPARTPPGSAAGGGRPVQDHRVEHHFLAGRADLVPADVQVHQHAAVGGLLGELDAGQREARVVDQRLARLQPEFENVVAQHPGDRPAALARQRAGRQLAQHVAAAGRARVLAGHQPAADPGVLEPEPQRGAAPGERRPMAGQAAPDRLGVLLERLRRVGEGLAEAAADVQDPRAEPGRPGPLEQPQALVHGPCPVARLAGVQVERQAEEVHRVPGRGQQVRDGPETGGRHAEPARPPGVLGSEPAHPDQGRHPAPGRPAEPGELAELPQVVDVDGDA